MIPNDWKSAKLGQISLAVTSGSRDWAQYYSELGSKFIRMTNLNRNGIELLLHDLRYVSINSASSDGKRTALQHGDILISITAELGKIGWIPDGFGDAYINQHTSLVRVDPAKAESKFIAYLLSSSHLNKIINSLNDSGAKAGLNLPTVRSIPISLPPFSEQSKIAEILSTWDKAITTTEQLLVNSQEQKKALMQQLLSGKKRFPKFDEKWKEFSVDQIFNILRGRVQKEEENGIYYLLGMGSVTESGALKTDSKTNVKTSLLKKNDLVMPERDIGKGLIIGRVSIIESNDSYVLGSNVLSLRLLNKEEQCPKFWFYLINSDLFRKSVNRLVSGTGQLMITAKAVNKINAKIPNIEEQQEIASVLIAADQEIKILQQKLNGLKQEKKALMQQLLTGKQRVKL